MDGFSKKLQAMVATRRIYCLTPDPKSMLMWSHYGGNHRGICLEFGIDNPLFGRAMKVFYRADYPMWAFFSMPPERAIELVLTKGDAWAYEDECRLVDVSAQQPPQFGQVVSGDFFRLPKGALKSVIAGCNADYDSVQEAVRAHMPDLPVKRVVRQRQMYRLEIQG